MPLKTCLQKGGAVSFGLWVALFTSCQSYDFEPVEPLAVAQTRAGRKVSAKRQKPNLTLLVDKSGSMAFPVADASGPTRWKALQDSMTPFLSSHGNVARMSMVMFPGAPRSPAETGCTPAYSFRTPPIDAATEADEALVENATNILNQLNSIVGDSGASTDYDLKTTGGTPTAQTLEWVRNTLPDDPSRDDFVLLLTDGLPNCNAALYDAPGAPNVCECLSSDINCPADKRYCIDRVGSVEAVKALAAKNIRTIVVGFGADTASGAAYVTLNAMAQAGGFPLSCPKGTDAECGDSPQSPNKCNVATQQCSSRFYFQASNTTELSKVLDAVRISIDQPPCEFRLVDPPADSKFISVLVDGASISSSANSWKYDAQRGYVVAQGELCTRLENSTDKAPIDVEIRYVEPL